MHLHETLLAGARRGNATYNKYANKTYIAYIKRDFAFCEINWSERKFHCFITHLSW